MPVYRVDLLHSFITSALKFERKLDKLQEDLTQQNKAILELTDVVSLLAEQHFKTIIETELTPKKKAIQTLKMKSRSSQLKKKGSLKPPQKTTLTVFTKSKMDYREEPKLTSNAAPQSIYVKKPSKQAKPMIKGRRTIHKKHV